MSHQVILARKLRTPPIEAGGQKIDFIYCPDREEFPEGASVYCSTSLDEVRADLIEYLPDSVGLIANLGVGVDNIDVDAAARRGISVSNTPVVSEDTADLTFALMLDAMRRVSVNEMFLRTGAWTFDNPIGAMGVRVHSKTLGLIGFGAIAQAVARRALGFNMKVMYTARSRNREAEMSVGARYCDDLDKLVSEADIVSVHTPLTAQTRGLIDAARLDKFKPGAVLINTARGAVVDERALAAALSSGRIAAAGLDVFEDEPFVSPALTKLENVVLTPHIGSATEECREDILKCGLANIITFLETGAPIDHVGGQMPRAAATGAGE
ncbi:MAG: D-glycerate dehydrogenase [Pseudomonadota bacterium]